jgi:hypothetical protein
MEITRGWLEGKDLTPQNSRLEALRARALFKLATDIINNQQARLEIEAALRRYENGSRQG